MSTHKPDSIYFKEIILHNYGPFSGQNKINFNKHRTLIAGPSGSGKTTIFNTLANLGPIDRLTTSDPNRSLRVDVLVEGVSQIIKDFHQLIFTFKNTNIKYYI